MATKTVALLQHAIRIELHELGKILKLIALIDTSKRRKYKLQAMSKQASIQDYRNSVSALTKVQENIYIIKNIVTGREYMEVIYVSGCTLTDFQIRERNQIYIDRICEKHSVCPGHIKVEKI